MALDAGSLVFQVFAKDDPLGSALSTLSAAYRKTVTVEDNGIGGGSFAIHPDDTGASDCVQDNYVAAWRDTVSGDPIAGFWIDKVETVVLSEDEGGGEEIRVSGRGPIAVLEEAIVWHKAKTGTPAVVYPAKNQWRWKNAHPMRPLVRLLEEAKTGRGCFDFVTWDFTRTLDSSSAAYSSDNFDEWSFEMGTDLLTVVRELREAGLYITMDASLVLHAWDSYDNDISGSIGFTAGTDIRDTSEIEAAARRGKSAVLVQGENKNDANIFRAVVNSTYETNLGRRKEAFWRYARTATHAILKNVGLRKLNRWKKQYDGPFTLGVIDTTNQVALVDYTVGDTVGVPTAFNSAGKERIASITLAEIDNGEYDPTLEFGDLAPDPVSGSIPSGDIEGAGCCGGTPGVGRGPGGGGGGSGSGSSGATVDPGEYPMEDFAGSTSEVTVPDVAEGVSHLYSEGITTATVNAPTTWADNYGYYLFALLHTADDTSVQTPAENAGLTKVGSTAGTDLYYRRITGDEASTYGWVTGSFNLEFGSTVELAAVTFMVAVPYEEIVDNPGLWFLYDPSATADPDPTPDPAGDGWDGEPALVITTCRTNGGAITGGPSGYTEAGTFDGTGIDYRVDYKILDEAAVDDPSTFTATGVEETTTWIIRGGGIAGWGSIPFGFGVDHEGPWVGGNTWDISVDQGSADYYIENGKGYVSVLEDDTVFTATLLSEDEDTASTDPWGPWAGGRGLFELRFSVDPTGDTGDAAPNYIDLAVGSYGWYGNFRINLGDDESYSYMDPDNQRGIVIRQDTTDSDFVAKTIASDTDYIAKFDTRGETIYAKLWAASATEPAGWDIAVAREYASNDGNYFILTVVGNDGMVFEFDYIDAALGTEPGGVIGRHVVGYGDGSTTTFSVGQPFVGGSLSVWVDNQPVPVASYDADSGTFTLAAAPYGDPTEGTAGDAIVEASWEAA